MAWRKRRASASRRRAFVSHSICRFFADLAAKRDRFLDCVKLESFPFEESFISVKNSGVFPDLILRAMRSDDGVFCGGELIEIKDSKSGYLVASFNSTLPSGKKRIRNLPSGLARRMVAAGDPGDSLPERDVYYLLRGKRKGKIKVCLVHGSFFETVNIEENIRRSFGQAIDEAARENEWDFSPELREKLLAVIARQKYFNSVRKVGDASVNLRFRLMADANPTGNLLNPTKYPQIGDDTINLLLPLHQPTDEADIARAAEQVFESVGFARFSKIKIKHPFNGWFLCFQTPLRD